MEEPCMIQECNYSISFPFPAIFLQFGNRGVFFLFPNNPLMRIRLIYYSADKYLWSLTNLRCSLCLSTRAPL